MAENRQQSMASEPREAPGYEKDGDVNMTGVDDDDPIEAKPIKVYPFSINELSEENARQWFYEMQSELDAQYAWQVIELYLKKDLEEYRRKMARPNWQRVNKQANLIMGKGLSSTTRYEIKDLKEAGERWKFLKERFLTPNVAMKAMRLMDMANWTWDRSKKASKAWADLKQMGLEFIEMNGSETIKIMDILLIWYLRGLGDDFKQTRDTLMSNEDILVEKVVLNRVQGMEHVYMQKENASRANQQQRPRGPKCYSCEGFGHIAARCPNQEDDKRDQSSSSNNRGNGRRGGRGGKGASRQSHRGRAAEDQDLDSPREEEYGGRAVDNVESRGPGEHSEARPFVYENAYRSTGSHDGWVFDSGATSMSTGDKSIFEYMDPCRGILTIANGVHMPIKGKGIVKFNLAKGQARLGGVIYVPGLAENLLSLEALHLAGYESRGSSRGYELMKNGKTVAFGKRVGRSTYLDSVKHVDALLVGPGVAKRTQYARIALSADEATAKKQALIHRRLGHPGRKRFNDCIKLMDMSELRLEKDDKLLNNNCEVCVKAKNVKLQSHIPVSKARRPLQRVYMDLWGPNREGSGDERYFLSLIDDCTRYSWLYVLDNRRSETIQYEIDMWLRRVERQAGQMLLIIRTDNAREFKALTPWGMEKGIEFEFIEAHTPPQNGVAERFNRVILDIARALLFDTKISKIYWKYAVLTANYLRNRTTLIKNSADENGRDRTAYELWTGHQPDLSHLRAWGCRVLYHDSMVESKLDSRVAEGTFMLYGKSDKQYYVMPRGCNRISDLKLVTNPEFREQEAGCCEKALANPPTATARIEPARPIVEMEKRQPIPMPAPMPRMAPMVPAERKKERGTELSEIRVEPTPQRVNEETDHGKSHDNGAERTPYEPEDDPQDANIEDVGAMEVDHHDGDQDKAQLEGEKRTWREATPDHNGERPSRARFEGEQETLEEPTPGQPSKAKERFDRQATGLPDGESSSRPPRPEPRDDGGRRSNKVEEHLNKVTPQTVNVERPDVRRSSRIRQPTERSLDSQDQQAYGRKRKTEGEEINDRPAQRLRARLAIATELLMEDREFEVNEEARAAREKAGIRLPKSYNDAVNDPVYGSKWREAIHKELSALISFGTWNVIRRSKANGTVSTTRWVFDVKLGPDGRIERFKARLVARGNEQSDDDFDETFAPVFRLDSLRILVALAARYGLLAHMLDASNAFAGSDLDKPNCMEIPEGLQDFDPEAREGMILELRKSLYGLRQSANLWHRKITGFLMEIGFQPTTADPSVFINNRGLIIALYVDDIVVFGREEKEIDVVKKKLKEFHPMTDSGQVDKLLGIRFTWGKDRSIRLDQQSYASHILEEFGMANCKPSRTPISPSTQLSDDSSPRLGRSEHKLFRRLIGRLIFLITATRPDISFVVNQLSQFLAEPRQVHLVAAKHVLRYIQATMDYGLVFGAKGRQGLVAYADSAYANSVRNRSTTGFVFMINGSPVCWNSRKQTVTAQSSTEAEYMAVSEAAKQAIWIRHFLYSIGKEAVYNMAPTTIYEDNQGAIKLADNPVNHPKTKHIAVRYHAIREHIANGEIRLEYLPTDRMLADGLTKATNHVTQERLVDGLGLA